MPTTSRAARTAHLPRADVATRTVGRARRTGRVPIVPIVQLVTAKCPRGRSRYVLGAGSGHHGRWTMVHHGRRGKVVRVVRVDWVEQWIVQQ